MIAPYFLVLVLLGTAGWGLSEGGSALLAAPLFAFGAIPLAELFMPPRHINPSEEEVQNRMGRRRFDAVVGVAVVVYLAAWIGFLTQVESGALTGGSYWGAVAVMGILCGGVGINVAHELGHRRSRKAQLLAKGLLGPSFYMHFFIEHNRGHHAKVATEEDPATSRRDESLYAFLPRSIIGGWCSAWELESSLRRRKGHRVWGLKNEMVRYFIAQVGLAVGLYVWGGGTLLVAALLAGLGGILLLETVNYLEHYGLQRSHNGRSYERVRPHHSWNSDHRLGRALLFELSRHSDHHAHPKRPFSVLRSFPDAPQLPTGYPGMVLLALIPPAFFAVMNPRLDALRN